mgnify:FL=1
MIVQLRGPGNRRAPPVLWQATYAWLSQQNYRPLVVLVDGAAQTRTKLVLKRIWEPLLTGIKATPHRASIEAFLKNGELWV